MNYNLTHLYSIEFKQAGLMNILGYVFKIICG